MVPPLGGKKQTPKAVFCASLCVFVCVGPPLVFDCLKTPPSPPIRKRNHLDIRQAPPQKQWRSEVNIKELWSSGGENGADLHFNANSRLCTLHMKGVIKSYFALFWGSGWREGQGGLNLSKGSEFNNFSSFCCCRCCRKCSPLLYFHEFFFNSTF